MLKLEILVFHYEQVRLRQSIWKIKHLKIGKCNALPPSARGAVCYINVGDANPIAQRVRPVAPKIRERLADLIRDCWQQKPFDLYIAMGVINSRDNKEMRRKYKVMYKL